MVARLPQRLKSTFFEEKILHFRSPSGTTINSKFFWKNIYFSLWGKHCVVLPKWTFFPCFSSLCTVAPYPRRFYLRVQRRFVAITLMCVFVMKQTFEIQTTFQTFLCQTNQIFLNTCQSKCLNVCFLVTSHFNFKITCLFISYEK